MEMKLAAAMEISSRMRPITIVVRVIDMSKQQLNNERDEEMKYMDL